MQSPDPYRWSNDSGHFTASEPSRSQSVSSTGSHSEEEQRKLQEYEAAHRLAEQDFSEKRGLLQHPKVQHYATLITTVISRRTMRILNHLHNLVDRVILVLGFIAIVTGLAVYGGQFVSLAGPGHLT